VSTAEQGVVWAIDVDGEVWRWRGGEITVEEIVNNVDHDWIHVPEAQLIKVDVGYNSQVVGIEEVGGNALFRTGVTPELVMGNGWANLGTGFTDITMCRNGLMWATDGQSVSFRTGIVDQVNNQGTGWEVVEQMGVTSINCGYRARLWLTTNTGEV